MEQDMPIIRKADNGAGAEIRVVSLGTLFAVIGVLGSVIGAQTTWLVAASSERQAVVAEFEKSLRATEAVAVTRYVGLETSVAALNGRMLAIEKQVSENTGILKAMRDK